MLQTKAFMEDEMEATVSHLKTSKTMSETDYDSSRKHPVAARQSGIIRKLMTAEQIQSEDLDPATASMYML